MGSEDERVNKEQRPQVLCPANGQGILRKILPQSPRKHLSTSLLQPYFIFQNGEMQLPKLYPRLASGKTIL
jgi:hypothetical protein